MLTEQERNRQKLQGFLDDKLKWHDYTHIVVADDDMEPAIHFIHTVGRAKENRPEFIITGPIDHQTAMDIIADADILDCTDGILDGQQPGDKIRHPVVFKDVSNSFVRSQRVAHATSRFGQHIRVFQIALADSQGNFPTDDNYNQQEYPQQALWLY